MKRKEIKCFNDLFLEVRSGFGIFPGLFFYLISPPYLKLWIMLLGVTVGEVIGKMVFGGFGQNIFNPALVGRAFIAFSFSNEIAEGYFNPAGTEVFLDAFSGATPLTHYQTLFSSGLPEMADLINPFNSLLNMFIGFIPGSIGEVSALCCILGYIYLSIKHVIDFKVPLIYISTVFLVTLTAGLIMGYSIEYPLYQILSGGLFFGAIFMATEPVTSPKTWFGKSMYAMLLGVLTVLFRLVGNLPEGVATAILTMNIFGLVLDKYAIKARVEGKIDKKNLPGLIIFIVIFVALFAYDVFMIV